MTSDDILTHAPRLGFEDAHIDEAICNWLREIAWQLAVANERAEREWVARRKVKSKKKVKSKIGESMTLYLSLLVALVGILMYALCANPKLQEIGRISFFCGLLTFLLHTPGPLVNLIR